MSAAGANAVAINLVRNYSPHLAPNTSTAPPTVELRQILEMAATEMLKVFLRKWRAKRRKDGSEGDTKRIKEVCTWPFLCSRRNDIYTCAGQAVDTVLAKLYTESGETTDLLALIDGPNDVKLSEVEPLLLAAQRYDALSRIYERRGDDKNLLMLWSK